MHSYMLCVCAVSIHLDTSVQVTNIGMNPPYVDLYYATTVGKRGIFMAVSGRRADG